eukprot:scaffold243_cov140-Skeletonema_menzelii.AAC.3
MQDARDKNGLYPLHRVADRNRYTMYEKSDEHRLELEQSIFEADPDVASIMDKELNLPPFALPERYEKSMVHISKCFKSTDEREENALSSIVKHRGPPKEVAEPSASAKRLK